MVKAHEINAALVGLGYWGSNYLRVLLQIRGINLAYICDYDRGKLTQYSEKIKAVGTTSLEELAKNKGLDAVIIATPAHTHFAIVKLMLEHGKHVLVEKPLALNSNQALELCNLAKQQKKILMVGHIYCYNPAVKYIKGLLKNRKLGDIYYGIGLRLGLGPIRSDASCIWDLAPHDVAMLDFLLDEMPARISAQASSFIQKGVYDYASIQLEYASGLKFSLVISWYGAEKIRNWYIVGSKAMIKFDDTNKESPVVVFKRTISRENVSEIIGTGPAFVPRKGNIIVPYIRQEEPLMLEVEHFVKSIKAGKKPLTDCEQGVRVTRILEAIDKSARNGGRPVDFDDN